MLILNEQRLNKSEISVLIHLFMQMSSKNILQEYLQKRGFYPPTYNTYAIAGTERFPRFKSELTLDGTLISSGIFPNKRDAEKDVAEKAMKYLEAQEPDLKNIDQMILLIDVENKPNFVFELAEQYDVTSLEIYCFISEDHPLVYKLEALQTKCNALRFNIIKTCSRIKDGADIALTFELGNMYPKHNSSDFVIVTGDHFGNALKEYLHGEIRVIQTINELNN